MTETLKRLFAHLEWADAQVLESFRATPPPPKALEIYGHLVAAEHVWLNRLRQTKPRYAVWPTFDVAECAEVGKENAAAFRKYVDEADATTLATEIPYVNSAGQSFVSRVDDILTHVAVHSAYHRGQVATLVRQGGGKPAPTDYIGFVRGVPAATRKP